MKYQAVFGAVLTGILALSTATVGQASANTSVDTLAGALTIWTEPFFQGSSTVDASLALGECRNTAESITKVGSAISTFTEGTVVFYSNSDCISPIGLPTGVYPDLRDARSYKLEPRA